jgi:hypothetical protein
MFRSQDIDTDITSNLKFVTFLSHIFLNFLFIFIFYPKSDVLVHRYLIVGVEEI